MVRGYSTLATRLKRLEAKRRNSPAMPTIFVGVYPHEAGEITGIGDGDGRMVERGPSEDVTALKTRAAAELAPARFLFMAYAEKTAGEAPPASDSGWGVFRPTPGASHAPLPGVGRIATPDELRRMGAIPIPPERAI